MTTCSTALLFYPIYFYYPLFWLLLNSLGFTGPTLFFTSKETIHPFYHCLRQFLIYCLSALTHPVSRRVLSPPVHMAPDTISIQIPSLSRLFRGASSIEACTLGVQSTSLTSISHLLRFALPRTNLQ